MEDKTIKVRCIKNDGIIGQITRGKEYLVSEESEEEYLIENDKGNKDTWYKKWLFEKIEDALIVECIDNTGYEGHLKLNKKYQVLEEDEIHYFIKNELDNKTGYRKERFKPVEPQKEVKEYTVMELFQEKDRTEFKDSRDIVVYPATIGLNKYLIDKASGTEIRVSEKLLNDKFTKVEEPKPVTTAEAFKALDEGKTIESCKGYKYKKENGEIKCKCKETFTVRLVDLEELEGQWIIH